MPPIPPVTQALMLVCTAVYCLQALLPGLGLQGLFALWPIGSGRFQVWQLMTHALLHADMMHLLFNMLGLWMFGGELERLWGARRYMQYLAAGALAGGIAFVLFGMVIPTGYAVGISGAIFALLLAFAVLFPNRVMMPLFPPIPMKARTYVIIFGVIELYAGLSSGGGVAHFAHLGGMAGGYLMFLFWRGKLPFGRRR